MSEMIGRVDRLDVRKAIDHWKARGLDYSQILFQPDVADDAPRYQMETQDHGLERALDNTLVERARRRIERREPVEISLPIRNVNRTVGTLLG